MLARRSTSSPTTTFLKGSVLGMPIVVMLMWLLKNLVSPMAPMELLLTQERVTLSSQIVECWGPVECKQHFRLENSDSGTSYLCSGRKYVTKESWEKLEGSFTLTSLPSRAIFYLEGPPPGVDILINSVIIFSTSSEYYGASKHATLDSLCYVNNNIISNHDFAQGLHSWHLNCCDGFVISGESSFLKGTALSGSNYSVITNRKEVWQGPEQDMTRNISPGLHYTVSAYVCVGATQDEPCRVIATLKLEHSDSTSYLFIERVLASHE